MNIDRYSNLMFLCVGSLNLTVISFIYYNWYWFKLTNNILMFYMVSFATLIPLFLLLWVCVVLWLDLKVRYVRYQKEQVKLEMYNSHWSPLPEQSIIIQDNEQQLNLEMLFNNVRALVIGQTGSGKSTLMRYVVTKRLEMGHQVFVIDPHGLESDWGLVPMGAARNFEEIETGLKELLDIMTERYELRRSGQTVFQPLVAIVDEWRLVTINVESARDIIKAILTEGRKVEMSMILAGHSDRAEPLGLKGEYDLVDGFLFVWMHGKGKAEMSLGRKANRTQISIPLLLPQQSQCNNDIENMVKQGMTSNDIYNKVGGRRQDVLAKIREVKNRL